MRVAILISGAGSNMAALVDDMGRGGHARPALVISNVPDAGGLALAAARGVPTATVDHRAYPDRPGFEAALARHLDTAEVDLICLAGFMRILTAPFVAGRPGAILNVHPSLLPLYPGLGTHARALAAGDGETGATVHEVTADLDAGPILGQARTPIRPGDTPATLSARVQALEHRLYPAVLRRVARGCRARLEL